MAVSSDPSTFRERQQLTLGPALLTVLSCGLLLPITIPIMLIRIWRRDREANTYRCPECEKLSDNLVDTTTCAAVHCSPSTAAV